MNIARFHYLESMQHGAKVFILLPHTEEATESCENYER